MTRSNVLRSLSAAVLVLAIVGANAITGATQETQQPQNRGITNVLLVHAAWADGSSWPR